MIRKGTRNGASYWFCHSCKHYFSGRSRVASSAVYRYYAQGTYTIAQIAERLGISCSTVKRRMKNFPLSSTSIAPRTVALQMDTTYWGRNFGVVLFMDVATHRVLHFRFIYRKERIEDYLAGIAYLKRQGIRVSGVISDGLSGLRKALAPIPYQYCQFHQIQRIRQLLTNHPKHPASIALKEIGLQLTQSDKKQFAGLLAQWHEQWKAYLEEKTFSENGASFTYTHRHLRTAYFSLTRHLDILYTYQCFPELGLPNTNNALESLNASLKTKLRLHRGISRERKQRLIQAIIIAYNPCPINES